MLLLFSFFIIFGFGQSNSDGISSIHWTGIVVFVIVTTMLIEEIQQVCANEK